MIEGRCNEQKSSGEEEDCSDFESTHKNSTSGASMKDQEAFRDS